MPMDLASYNRLGQVYCAANVSAKSVIAVTTAMTGVILYNPPGSGKVLLIADCGFAWTTTPAATHNIGLALGAVSPTLPTSTTAIGSGVKQANGSGNAGASVALAYDAATLPAAPVAARWFGGSAYQAATAAGVTVANYYLVDKVDGALIVVPGSSLSFTVVTTTAVGLGSVSWVEVPL